MKTTTNRIGLLISAFFVILPPIAYFGFIVPYAEKTADPDKYEALPWIVGIFLMFVGVSLFLTIFFRTRED